MGLTALEKQAGRAFRDAAQAVLDSRNRLDPPGVFVLPLWRVVRHECPAAGGASIGITLREECEESPEYWGCYCGTVTTWGTPNFPHEDCDGSSVIAVVGRFAFVWKEGKCSGCGLTVRTRRGRFVADRPLSHGRTSGEQRRPASPHP
jgi:hypothetical protein